MNYIELINNFWALDESWQFSCCETRLYFYLIKTANRLGWLDNWTHSDDKTSANVGVSKNKLKTSRNKLVQAGLIAFKEGGKGHANKTRYQILQPKSITNLQPNKEPNLNAKPAPLLDKLNETKPNALSKEDTIVSKKIKSDSSKETSKSKNPSSKPFIKPSLEEIEEYIASTGGAVSGEAFFDYYESNGWMVGKNKMKDWKAALRSWERKEGNRYNNQTNNNNNHYEEQNGKSWKNSSGNTNIDEEFFRNIAEGVARAEYNQEQLR